MTNTLALTKLYDDVVALFAAENTAVPNLFGWRASGQQLTTGPRIVWIPGDETGDMGELGAAIQPGRDPRSLATLVELFTIEVSSADQSSAATAENERAQYQICRDLFDAWYRAVYLSAHGNVAIESVGWVTEKKERRYGATIRAVCTINAMIPDETPTFAPVDTAAQIATTELDVTETETVTATSAESS